MKEKRTRKTGQRLLAYILTFVLCLQGGFWIGTDMSEVKAETSGDWEYTITDNEVTIKGYNGDATDVVIPDTIEGCPVTEIGYMAFYNCTGLTSVMIPSGVTTLGSVAFANCTGLTSITIPSSVNNILDLTFAGCIGLTNIQVDENNEYYDSRNACNAIIETSTNTLITGCKNTIIPQDVTSIGNRAFANCTGLISITIPSGVTKIENGAFYNCTGLTSISIPSGVTSVGWEVFRGCDNLTNIQVDENNAYYDSRNDCNAIIETSTNTLIAGCKNTIISQDVTEIGKYAFAGCTGLTSITIPSSVTSIYQYAFAECTGLTGITIPSSVDYVGERAFEGCTGLTDITISSSVKNIEFRAFAGCTGLTSITIPSSVTSINEGAFIDCSGLTSIKVDENNPNYDSRNDCNAIIETSTNTLIIGCKNTIIPQSVTCIGGFSFVGCDGLTSIEIPSNVKSIDGLAFYECTGLTSITIPSSVISIDDEVFDECPNLVILAEKGSYAEQYAKDNNIPFVDVNEPAEPEIPTDPEPTDPEPTDPEPTDPEPTDPKPTEPEQPEEVKVLKITISGMSNKIAAGKKLVLTAKISPSNALNKAVTWSTSNRKYATVNSKGVVTIKKAGAGKSVTITATAKDGSNIKAKYKISIMKHAVKSIKLSAKTKSVKNGKKLTLRATVKTTGKKVNKTLKWSSSNTKYATVSSKGVVKTKKAGKGKRVKITAKATDGTGKKATITIKIK